MVAASCTVLALAAPAQAGAADNCTTVLVWSLLSGSGTPQYPIIEQDDSGSIHIHPQNIEPAVGDTLNRLPGAVGQTVLAIDTWVDCVV